MFFDVCKNFVLEHLDSILYLFACGYIIVFIIVGLTIGFGFCDNSMTFSKAQHICGVAILWPLFLLVFLIKVIVIGVNDLCEYIGDVFKSLIFEEYKTGGDNSDYSLRHTAEDRQE